MSSTPSLRRVEMRHSTREALYGYAFVMIWIVGFAVFTLAPLLQTFIYSLNQVTVEATGVSTRFVEWANYSRALVTDPTFVELLIGYMIETLISLPIIVIFSMIIALFLNLDFKGKGIFRTIFFLPVVITSGPVIKELTEQGATSTAGLTKVAAVADFLAQMPSSVRAPVEYLLTSFILILWFSGVQILIYLSSLQKVDKSLYEAAAIDGASAWESFWKITLPSLTPTTLVIAVYTVITLSHFSENKVVQYIYKQTYAVEGGIGYASAMSFIYFVILVALLAVVYFFFSFQSRRTGR